MNDRLADVYEASNLPAQHEQPPSKGEPSRYEWLASGAAAIAAALAAGTPSVAVAQTTPAIKFGLPLTDMAGSAYYADQMGLFKKVGLNVEVQPLSSGPAIAASVAGGAVQVGGSNILALAQGYLRGVRFTIIAPGARWDGAFPDAGLLVSANSPLKRGRDLNGKIVAGATVGGLDQLAVAAYVARDGGDVSSIKFVELSPSVMAEGVIQGRVDAVVASDPTFSAALASKRLRLLDYPYNAIAKRFMLLGWFVTAEWLSGNKTAARTIAQVLAEASTWAMNNPERAAVLLKKYMPVTEERASARFADKLDPALIQPFFDAAHKFGFLAAPVSSKDVVWDGK